MDPPDREEKVIRAGCGAVFGLYAAVLITLWLVIDGMSWWVWLPLALAIVAWSGYSAMKRGDEFWEEDHERPLWWWFIWLPWW